MSGRLQSEASWTKNSESQVMLHHKLVAELIGPELSCSHDFDLSCDTCRMRIHCLPAALDPHQLTSLESIIERRRTLQPGECLYEQNQAFTSLYAVIAGAVKNYSTHEDGWVRITGCRLAGEIFGFSGIDTGHYRSTARALEETLVCEIPFAELEDLCRKIPDLQSRLLHLMSQRLVEDHELAAQFMHKRPARKRIAAFLVSLSTRAARRGDSITHLHLPMSRTDIGNYLGITLETVCRELARLVKLRIIDLHKRELTVLDLPRLRAPICEEAR
jgi:CRP/FNR family transcriptional regulator